MVNGLAAARALVMGEVLMRDLAARLAVFLQNQSGATGAEYALLLAVIGVGLAVGSTTLGTAITNAFDNISGCINAGLTCTP